MGIFGTRRGNKESTLDKLLSPGRNASGSVALSKTQISTLFSDGQNNYDADTRKTSSPPTVAMDEISTRIPTSQLFNDPNDACLSDQPDRVSRMNARYDDDPEPEQELEPELEEDPAEDVSRAEAIAIGAHRDSLKRSISWKIKLTGSRRQNVNALDKQTKTPKSSDGSSSKSLAIENQAARLALSPGAKPARGKENIEPSGSQGDPASEESSQIDLDIIGEAEVKSHVPQPESLMVLSRDPVGLGMPGQGESRKNRTRRRPPPLLAKSGGEPDSAMDWPSAGLFGSDGGFMTGGFKITAEGMVGRPDFAQRCDSHVHVDPEVPVSTNQFVLVRSLKEFRAGPTIGSGAAGRVYIAEHTPSKVTMAIKVVNVYSKEKRNQLLKELETLSTHTSRYLVRFFGAFYDGSGAVHIALEYMDHGCLSTFVQRVGGIPEQIVQMIANDCLRGLRFLHRHHVLHRDFKTANILLSRRQCCAKLSDFGLARDLNPGISKVDTFVGTVAYMSPERLQGTAYTYASDIWALGVSIVECLIGRHPFNRPQNYFDYIEASANSSTLSGFDSVEKRFSAEARDFVKLCTFTEAQKRPTAFELLQHPWVKDVKRNIDLFGSWLDECRTRSMQVNSQSGSSH